MTLAATQYNPDGIVHKAMGSRTGSRTAGNFTISLGFAPKKITVINLTDRVKAVWFKDAGNSKQLLTAANGDTTYADAGIAVGSAALGTESQFTVTVATAGLETDNDDVVWEAE